MHSSNNQKRFHKFGSLLYFYSGLFMVWSIKLFDMNIIILSKLSAIKFIEEVFNYGTNQAKWKAAKEYCEDRGMKFLVLTEKDLGLD